MGREGGGEGNDDGEGKGNDDGEGEGDDDGEGERWRKKGPSMVVNCAVSE